MFATRQSIWVVSNPSNLLNVRSVATPCRIPESDSGIAGNSLDKLCCFFREQGKFKITPLWSRVEQKAVSDFY